MWKNMVSGAVWTATFLAAAGFAQADEPTQPSAAAPSAPELQAMAAPDQGGAPGPTDSPIPPNVEAQAVPNPAGGYCYGGPHPVDTRVEGGAAFDPTQGSHIHPYAPIDLRLFTFRDGCYYFIGDPRDFGYDGQTYSYYGAHPVLDAYGGGWCFMMGGHYHLWQPWSPYFTVVGPWHYWYGPYDPFFWAYWPYYSFYYRSYYPRYYAGGRFYRGGVGVAPPIRRVPAPSGWRGTPTPNSGSAPLTGGWRGTPPGATGTSSSALRSPSSGWGGGAAPAPSSNGWRGAPVPNQGIRPSAPSPSFRPSAPSFRPSPSPGGGGFRGGGGWRGGGGHR